MKIKHVNSKKRKIAKIRYFRACSLITVLAISFFALFITIYTLTVLYGNIPWMELNTWKSFPYKEYSFPQMIIKSKNAANLDKITLLSPFLNATFTKARNKRYEYPTYEFNQIEKGCKHFINYDMTIPPGGWIIYSSCQKSLENPQGYNSIRAIGYPAYGKSLNISSPVNLKYWYHAFYNHIRVPIQIY